MHAYRQAYIHTYRHTYQAYIHTYRHTYIHTTGRERYIHTYRQAYIHTHTYIQAAIRTGSHTCTHIYFVHTNIQINT